MHIYRNAEEDRLYLDLGVKADPRFVSFIYWYDNDKISTSDVPSVNDGIPTMDLVEITSPTFIDILRQRTEYLIDFCQTDFMHMDCNCDMVWNIISYKLKNYGQVPKKLNLKIK